MKLPVLSPWQRNAGGIALIILGVIAVPIPIVPGLPIIAAGAAMLNCHNREKEKSK